MKLATTVEIDHAALPNCRVRSFTHTHFVRQGGGAGEEEQAGSEKDHCIHRVRGRRTSPRGA